MVASNRHAECVGGAHVRSFRLPLVRFSERSDFRLSFCNRYRIFRVFVEEWIPVRHRLIIFGIDRNQYQPMTGRCSPLIGATNAIFQYNCQLLVKLPVNVAYGELEKKTKKIRFLRSLGANLKSNTKTQENTEYRRRSRIRIRIFRSPTPVRREHPNCKWGNWYRPERVKWAQYLSKSIVTE